MANFGKLNEHYAAVSFLFGWGFAGFLCSDALFCRISSLETTVPLVPRLLSRVGVHFVFLLPMTSFSCLFLTIQSSRSAAWSRSRPSLPCKPAELGSPNEKRTIRSGYWTFFQRTVHEGKTMNPSLLQEKYMGTIDKKTKNREKETISWYQLNE